MYMLLKTYAISALLKYVYIQYIIDNKLCYADDNVNDYLNCIIAIVLLL